MNHRRSIVLVFACLLVWSAVSSRRNYKKGLSIHTTQSCQALVEHTTSSWWYSWNAENDGFSSPFCQNPGPAVAAARDDGMDFVPMFWGGVPTRPFSEALDFNLRNAKYLFSFNEPEMANQANIAPTRAAQLWPQVEDIAEEYNLTLTMPCVANSGTNWLIQWLDACQDLYDRPCHYDHACVHLYYQPYPCDPHDHSWACIQEDAKRARRQLTEMHSTFGKPIWVNEYSCAPWGSTTNNCSLEEDEAIMTALTELMEELDFVYRYAWFTAMGDSDYTKFHALNELVIDNMEGFSCPDSKWLGRMGSGKAFQRRVDCVRAAASTSPCYANKPNGKLIFSLDSENCYCSLDACEKPVASHPWMHLFQQVSDDLSSSSLTALGHFYNSIVPGNYTATTSFVASQITSSVSPILRKRIIFAILAVTWW